MFVRYLGGGIGHGGNTADIEIVPDDDPGNASDDQLDDGHGKEGDNEVGSESEDEDALDGERTEYGKGDTENEYSDDEERDIML